MSYDDLKRSDKKHALFVKLCGMFGSNYEGEVANAAIKATGLLREFNATWDDILNGGSGVNDYAIRTYQNDINRLTRINNNLNQDNRDLREKLGNERNKNYELNSKMHQLRTELSNIQASIAQQKKDHVWKMDDEKKAGGARLKIPRDDTPKEARGWREIAETLLQEMNITEWETNFLESILSRRSLSEKQEAVLNRMAGKYGV